MDMDGDWLLPKPNTRFKTRRRKLAASLSPDKTRSVASTFSSLALPVIAEAARKAEALSAAGDPEGFHQLRIAFRKLRALFWAYSPYLGEEATAEATEEFKRLAAVAGCTRDWDIAGGLLDAALKSGMAIEPLVAAARERRARAVEQSQAMIRSDAVEAFLNDVLLRAQATLQTCCDDLPIRPFARKRLRRAKRTLRARSRRAAQSAIAHEGHEQALHDVRKAGKKLRYLLEFFQPVVKGRHARDIKALTSVQDKLGQFNDIAASETLIRETAFDDVPAAVVEESLRWLGQQKRRRMRAASRRVKSLAR